MNNESLAWVEKYRPKTFSEIKCQELVAEKLKLFIKYFGAKKKSIILHGAPGTGKTSLAYALGNEFNAEVFELNASDFRDKKRLNEILRPAIEQRSLTKTKKIILVDEVDGISTTDYGGVTELLSLIETTSYPVIITANDIWGKKFSDLRKKSEVIILKNPDHNAIRDILFQILKKENIFLNDNIVTSLAVRAKGDVRAAINDLQSASRMRDPSLIIFDERDKDGDIFNALKSVFKEKPNNEILKVFDSVKMPIDEVILWVEENIPLEYKGKSLARAYDLLSKADLFRGRIYKQQYWRFLVYENIFLSYGISSSKKELRTNFTSYKKPERILKIWLNNQRTAKIKSITQKYAKKVHIGEKRAMREFPIIKYILKNPKVRQELKLSEEEISYLNGLSY